MQVYRKNNNKKRYPKRMRKSFTNLKMNLSSYRQKTKMRRYYRRIFLRQSLIDLTN